MIRRLTRSMTATLRDITEPKLSRTAPWFTERAITIRPTSERTGMVGPGRMAGAGDLAGRHSGAGALASASAGGGRSSVRGLARSDLALAGSSGLDSASDLALAGSGLDSADSALAGSGDSAALTPSAVLAMRPTSAHTPAGRGPGPGAETQWPAVPRLAEAGQV